MKTTMLKTLFAAGATALMTLSAQAVTTYTVTNTGEGTGSSGTLQYALTQVDGKTSGEYLIKFDPRVYGQTIKCTAFVTEIATKVTIDGTGSGVTLVMPGSLNTNNFFRIAASTGDLVVSNVTVTAAHKQFVYIPSASTGAKAAIVGCRFENCTLYDYALLRQLAENSLLYVERTTFIGNTATNESINGSCIQTAHNGRLVLNLCSFLDNSTTGRGGAVFCDSTNTVVVANCTFAGNRADGNGQAVYLFEPRDAWFVESLFFNQDSTGEGSDIYTKPAPSNAKYTSRVTLAHSICQRLGYETLSGVTFNYTWCGGGTLGTETESICTPAELIHSTRAVDGVRQTAPYPCVGFAGTNGYCTLYSTADWSVINAHCRTASGGTELSYVICGGTGGSMLVQKDIFGTARPTAAERRNPTTGTVQYGERETPSLTVTTLEDVVCPVGGEISFREAVRSAAENPALAADGRAVIEFAPSVTNLAEDGVLDLPVTGGDIVLDGALTNNTLVVAPPEGLRLRFHGVTNALGEAVTANRLFDMAKGTKLELRDADVCHFKPQYDSGGALRLQQANTLVASNVLFHCNSVNSAEAGGAIYVGYRSNLRVWGSAFSRNAADCCGGAVYIADGEKSSFTNFFERTSFFHNATVSTLDTEGGAVYVGSGHAVFANVAFHRNEGHVAALQVRPHSNVLMVNASVTDSNCRSDGETTAGTAIEIANSSNVWFRAYNSVIGGYSSAEYRRRKFCQLRSGAYSKISFFNTLASENNAAGVATPANRRFYECTEEDLAECAFGDTAAMTVHGVRHTFLAPRDYGSLYGGGVFVRHSADWYAVTLGYGSVSNHVLKTFPKANLALDNDLLDNDYTSEVVNPSRQRTIGPIWSPTASDAKSMAEDYGAEFQGRGARLSLTAHHENYLPPVVYDFPVVALDLDWYVSSFNPILARSATSLREYTIKNVYPGKDPYFKTVDGVLYSYDGSTLVAVPPACASPLLVAPGTTTVGSNAFAAVRAAKLEGGALRVELPGTVTAIRDGAFADATNTTVYLRGMTAPTCSDFAFTNATDITVCVPVGSTGWDGDPASTELPSDWHGAKIANWTPTEYPSLEVTTLDDVTDPTDSRISLREAIGYANEYAALSSGGLAEITFAAGLPVNEETGKMELSVTNGAIVLEYLGCLASRTLVLAPPLERPLAVIGSSNLEKECFLLMETRTKAELRNVEVRGFGPAEVSSSGGALSLEESCTLVVSNCFFRMNKSSTGELMCGGALYVVGPGSDVRVYDSCFYNNESASGSAVYVGSSAGDVPSFVLFERTSFSGNKSTAPVFEGVFPEEGGAVGVGSGSRVVFNHCSLIDNRGHVSDLLVMDGAEVTMVNTAVSDSEARKDASDGSGSAIELCQMYPEFDAPVFTALNCVFGGYKEKSSRNRDYCMIRSGTNAQVRLCNSIVSANHQLCRTEDGNYSATGVWFYSEDDMTNFVYDVTSNNVASSTVVPMLYRPNLSCAPKMFRPLGTNSVLYGAGVRVLHDADWKNVSWKYDYLGDLHALRTDETGATPDILVDRDLLGNSYGQFRYGTISIGPLRSWRKDLAFEEVAAETPDYLMEPDIDDDTVCVIRPPQGLKFLPPICGGRTVRDVAITIDIESVDPSWAVSAPGFENYVALESPIYTSMGGCLYTQTADGLTLVAAPPGRRGQSAQEGTRVIGANAFRYAMNTTQISLPPSVRHFGEYSFACSAFAENGIAIYLYATNAPTYALTAFDGLDASSGEIDVPYGSKGWNGDPESTALPEPDRIWPTDEGVGCLSINNDDLGTYFSLKVTTLADNEADDGFTSLREALYAVQLGISQFFDNGVATVTFDPSLADANGVINLAFDESLGPIQLWASEGCRTLILAAPANCRVRLRGCAEPDCVAESGAFEVNLIKGTLLLAGFDVEGFSATEGAGVCSDWESTYVGEVVISNCTFRNCWGARDGGAVHLSAVKASVIDSIFTDNRQTSEDYGGGAMAIRSCGHNENKGLVVIDRCSFHGNYAKGDGALSLYGCNDGDRVVISDTTISGNTSADDGGAAVGVHDLADVTIANVTMYGNTSGYEVSGPVELINCVMEGTVDPGAEIALYNSVTNVDLSDWLGSESTATNIFTGLAVPCRAPLAAAVSAGWVVNFNGDWSSIVCVKPDGDEVKVRGSGYTWDSLERDMLGFVRSENYNAIGALGASPAEQPTDDYAAWTASKGLFGADAAWNAKPAKWGGSWANAFIYAYGEGLADGTLAIMDVSFDADGRPVITTAPTVEGHDAFCPEVIGTTTLDDWTDFVHLEQNEDDWTLPEDTEANFFRVRLND